ncbi:MAG: sorbitol dehydrogenase [Lentisphaerae bacterium RIFOXYB12_FULL_65_16]|nr:MAG: sorbitol dehydrogenase [Lentisphaerae bacterium RIFOXYA12_64_32]OGV92355.1 MAG: sorbitol dehydrogenase [Lentisphaerae bacterium RIFOXYB12_FULL_65_16]
MKAFRIVEAGKCEIVALPVPAPQPGDVLLKVCRVGFCGSDLNTYLGRNPMVTYPRIPGHEIAATIDSVTVGVPDNIKPGMPVTVVPYTNCGVCSACRRGRPHACRSNQTLGVQRDGALTEYITVPWQKLVLAPALSLAQLTVVEPLTVGFHAVARGSVAAGDVVAVFGCGMIGMGAVAGAAVRGAKVIAVDIDDAKLALARRFGAAEGVNSRSANLHDALQKLTSGNGPDVIIEAVGSPVTYRAAVDEVAFTGRVVCIGYAKDDVSFTTKYFVQKELDILGSRNATPADFAQVTQYLAATDVPLDAVISRVCSLGQAAAALADWAANPGAVMKIIVDVAG